MKTNQSHLAICTGLAFLTIMVELGLTCREQRYLRELQRQAEERRVHVKNLIDQALRGLSPLGANDERLSTAGM